MRYTQKVTFKTLKNTLSRWGFSKHGLFFNTKGEWYLFSQILLILFHAIQPYPKLENLTYPIKFLFIIIGLIISIRGLLITIRAFIDLGDNLTPLPYPMNDSILIKTNSYKNTRHPLYKGLIFISFGLFITLLSLIHLFIFLLLAYSLKIKALKEEKILKIKFPEYEKYIEDVPAIIKNVKYLDWRS